MKRITLLCFLALALSFACQAKANPELIVLDSPNLGVQDSVLVFSPKKPAGNNLILLHGRSGCFRDWSIHMDLEKLSNETGFRIICPDGFRNGWYIDNEGGRMWRKFFWEELWPLLEKKYGLDPEHTFIDGLSMGGHGAMNLFLDHPERFRGAGSMSGVLNLTHTKSFSKDIANARGLSTIPEEELLSLSAVTRLPRLKEICGEGAANKVLLISSGVQDRFAVTASQFSEKCHELGYRHILMISPGKHRWSVWVWTIKNHLTWFGQVADGEHIGEK